MADGERAKQRTYGIRCCAGDMNDNSEKFEVGDRAKFVLRNGKIEEGTVRAVQNTTGQYRVLYALLAGSRLRIGEALGLEVGKHVSSECRTLSIRQSVWEGSTQKPKTASAIRDVDLVPR
jgi:hypothetical protein